MSTVADTGNTLLVSSVPKHAQLIHYTALWKNATGKVPVIQRASSPEGINLQLYVQNSHDLLKPY